MARYTVLVTGGNGFLGQHIVRLLQEKADFVTHIKVLDIRKFSNQLNYKERKPVAAFVGDVTDESVLENATSGVDCVVHVASVVDVRMFADDANLHKVNVTGTEQLLHVCIRQNVRSFVYCSSQNVVMGYKDLIDSNETLEVPSDFLFKGYGVTKHLAEQVVEHHDGASLPDGGTMRALTLRPVTMYGELDFHWVPHTLKWAKRTGGMLCQFANGTMQAAYVGNVAWGFVCAVKAMRENPDLGAEVFFVCDDTPLANMCQLVEPFLKSRGFKLTPFVLPYWLMYCAVILLTCMAWLIYPIYQTNSTLTTSSVRFMNMRINSVYSKAKKILHYTPLYSHEESLRRSIEHYKTI
ncbi:3 beta-hydroxysteroid dehydrogenase/Delta 5--_4-isomerase-like [Mizuhopecten yessoensis]|uniref:3 beta-hydroxysteroid dehydrogenase/Delta 5-->4-isomerase n=1 Tax=Mizuhopecten yessoensis TaxID=6573 RepID=A0A210QCR8_MIZYE|nr:3 beta-hydroxysteroid dehydrogenase/Delta 5-->4-isomerase-like [Mizuhopecten yessoensis]XP_021361453.1 3 beta-hydroxysteroid dehydrogenase/Delta 5-->4-isomerase-like [Mizuhopecten yessoensis]XP_021361454.1 3 beta-hydroxysteroid dehydrogenase/Delta 5-->4-isomerase-like [Mizuhopecten yessoensis]XP_021361455.1 3 beta-hydroxysteroid dehydrogenase/Delta 5-->4-isomerase-like [Mizuhopecten yessoensis]OWF46557.1 3 beta-hydroxysteroid dehydrogenase/Delta 5-->4-isomerase [Mizuhopecten yessoensis]